MAQTARKHTWYEDLFGIATGVVLITTGILFMQAGGLLTGGAVGLAQLIATAFEASLSPIYVLISIPFFFLAIWKMGIGFASKSFLNILIVSFVLDRLPHLIHVSAPNQLVAAVIGNTLAGMGVLAFFRHNSSLGGFQIIALYIQDKFKVQAGLAQALIDVVVLVIGLSTYSLTATLNSFIGVVIFNGILAINHRPDLYIGRSA